MLRNYSATTSDGTYTFESGDILKAALIDISGNVYNEQEIELTEGDTDVDVTWTADDMSELAVGHYIIEAELTTTGWTKTVQEEIEIYRDYIVGE